MIDLLEKHKGTGGFKLTTVTEAARYLTRTMGAGILLGLNLEALSQYIARDGAAWVHGANFHTKKFGTMIKELELAARPSKSHNGNPFGLLVLSTSKNNRPVAEQMEKLKLGGFLALKYLGVAARVNSSIS